MPIPPVSPYNMVVMPQEVNSRALAEQYTVVATLNEPVQKSLEKQKSDSVVLSKKAVAKAKEGEEAADEPQEHHDEMERVERRPDGTYHPRGR